MKQRILAFALLMTALIPSRQVMRAQSCTYTVTPTTLASGAAGSAGLFTVTASDPSCAWTATSGAGWASVSDPIGGYAGRVLSDGAVGYWRVNESTGTAAVSDFSGHALTGSLEGGVTLQQSGAITGDAAAAFDGTGAIAVTPSTSLAMTTGLTIEAWVKTASVSTRIAGAAGDAWTLGITSSGHAQFAVGTGAVDSTGTVSDNAWHHLVGTWDGTWTSMYVDGVLDAQSAAASTIANTTDGLMIGAHPLGANLTGSLDEIALYPQALSGTQVSAHYALRTNSGAAGSGAIGYAVEANASTSSRSTTLTVAGQSVSLTQDGYVAPTCVFDVAPASISTGADGGVGGITVTANDPACAWTASSDAAWATVTAPIAGYAGRVLSDGALGYWRLDEATASATVGDLTGRGQTGFVQGGVTLQQSGAISGNLAASLDGTGAINVGQSSALSMTTAVSVEAWIKTIHASTRIAGAMGDAWTLAVTASGRAQLGINGHAVDSVRTVTDNQWHHVVGTWDGTSLAIYVDGVIDRQAAYSTTLANTANGIKLGADSTNGSRLIGGLDEVAVYGQPLTPTQVTAHYALRTNAGTAGSGVAGYAVGAQTSGTGRTATLTIAGQSVGVTQAGLVCSYGVSPASIVSPALGAAGVVSVAPNASSCTWSASSDAGWVTLGTTTRGYPAQVRADGAVGYWRLGEITGSTAADSTGHGLTGTISAGVTLGQTGAIADGNTAAAFDGIGGSIQVPPSLALNLTTALSLEAWVKTTSTASQRLVGKGSNGSNWDLWLSASGVPYLQLGRSAGVWALSGATPVANGQWHHVVGAWDGATASLFVDGVLDATAAVAGPLVSSTGNTLLIGRDPSGFYTSGQLDDVAVYGQALTAAQVASHFALRTSTGTGGVGVVPYVVASNASSARSATITAAGQAVGVSQSAAGAGPALTVNSVTAPGSVTVLFGNTLTAAVTGGPGNRADLVTLAKTGSPTSSYEAWQYLNGTTSLPSTGLASATLTFALPAAGAYELRFFANNSLQLLATSASIRVVAGPQVAGGSSLHTVVLTDTGTIWAWGTNGNGQLGTGNTVSQLVPTATTLSNVAAIAAGGASTWALKSDGTVWGWGDNFYGQLGDGTNTGRLSPVAASGLSNVIAIAAGASHVLALKSDGTVWAWGDNRYGQIGDATTTQRKTPVQVTALGTSVKAIAANSLHSLAVKADGTVWAWGYNASGQLGDGTVTPRNAPVQTTGLSAIVGVGAGNDWSFAWDAAGALKGWGYNGEGELGDATTFGRLTPVSVSGLSGVAGIRGGNAHSVAAKTDGSVWAWGYNAQGQVGDGTTTWRLAPLQVAGVDAVSVSASVYSSVAVSSDGRVWSWGYNYYGQLGDGTYTQATTPIQLSDPHFAWRVATPFLSPVGGSYANNVNVTVTDATAGATMHYTTNGADPLESDPTVASGGVIAVTQTTTLKVKAWKTGSPASNVASVLYSLTVQAPSITPAGGTYTTAQTVTMSSSTSGATIRYTTDGSTPTTASAVYTAALSISTGTTVKAIALKANWTTSTVASAAFVFNYGTLATPTFTPVPSQIGYGTQVSISAAAFATIRYTTNGTTPTAASPVYTAPITVTGTTTILAKAFHPDWTTSAQGGGAFTVKVSSPAFSPGAGTYAPGQLVTITDATPGAVIRYTTNGATPTATDPIMPTGGTVVAGFYTLKAQAFLSGWTTSDVASAAYAISSDFTNWAVDGGPNHTIALKNDGTVWSWGLSSQGAIGETGGRTTPAMVNGVTGVVAISTGVMHTLALRSDGTVWSWGDNSFAQRGDNPAIVGYTFTPITGLSSVTAIAAGSYFSVALKSDGTVWAWGANGSGQLGDGTQTPRTAPTQVPGFSGVVAIAAGDSHTVVRKADGTVWAWGANSLSQLGDGTQTLRTSPVQVPGLVASAGPWAGYAHSLVSTTAGSLYAWGWNNSGQSGGTSSAATPRPVSGVASITTADGSGMSIARASDGTVWTFGKNSYGQIGDGTTANASPTPYQVPGLSGVAAVAAGVNHSVIVTSDGSVWAWGYNGTGALGDGTLNDRLTPVRISEPGFDWKTSTPRLSPYSGSFSATTAVTVTTMTPATEIHYTTNGIDPTQSDATVTSGGTVSIDQTGTLKARAWASGMPLSNVAAAAYTMNLPVPTLSPGTGTYLSTQSVTISSSVAGATVRYTTDGTDPTATSAVYSSAVSVDATTTIKAKAFRAGWTDSATATTTYTLKAVPPTFSPSGGGFSSAQTVTISTTTPSAAIRYTLDSTEPTAASALYSAPIAVSATATVKAIAIRTGWTTSDSSAASFWITQGTAATPTFSPAAGTYTAPMFVIIATATSNATLRYTLDGSDPVASSPVYQWPVRLDASTTVKAKAFKDGFTPSAVGASAYALDAAGAVDTPVIGPGGGVFAAGLTAAVTVQASGATLRYTTNGVDPIVTDPIVPVGGVAVDRSMVVKVKAWSGSADASAVRRADFVVTGALSASEATSHALKADRTVWSWGAGGWGQIGDGQYLTRDAPVLVSGVSNIVAIASATYHTLAVKADGTVWSWGSNSNYQLGDNSSYRGSPAQVAGLTQIVAVAAGLSHSVALRDDGTVWTWGGNASGQLGDGTTTPRSTPTMVAGLHGVSRIAAGSAFTVAIESDGTTGGRVWAWGDNTFGALGDGSRLRRLLPVQTNAIANAVAIAAGPDFAIVAAGDGTVWTWGHNDSGQLGDTTLIDRLSPVRVVPLAGAVAVTAGRWHAAASTDDGRVWTWGSDSWWQLGDSTSFSRYAPQPINGLSGALVMAAGDTHTLVVQPNGAVMVWGMNGSGRLGDGSETLRATPVAASGLSLVTNTWLTGDQDADSLLTWREYLIGTDPLNADTTGSGIGDRVLVAAGYRAANTDIDGDGLSNAAEIALGTDPFNADTDGDGVADALDCFPLDPTRSACLVSNPTDHTPPVITLIEPTTARRIP